MRRCKAFLFILAFLFLPAGTLGQNGKAPRGPRTVVQQFYDFHFSHDMAFTEESVKAKASWLSEGLLSKLLKELAKPSSPDEVPNIDGDPFTDSQEYPQSFRIISSSSQGSRASIKVMFKWPDRTRMLTVTLILEAGSWRIDNFVYGKGKSLRSLLG